MPSAPSANEKLNDILPEFDVLEMAATPQDFDLTWPVTRVREEKTRSRADACLNQDWTPSMERMNLQADFAIVQVAPSGSTNIAPRVELHVKSNPAPVAAGKIL